MTFFYKIILLIDCNHKFTYNYNKTSDLDPVTTMVEGIAIVLTLRLKLDHNYLLNYVILLFHLIL